jgi:DNA-binding response OmpR family regulator
MPLSPTDAARYQYAGGDGLTFAAEMRRRFPFRSSSSQARARWSIGLSLEVGAVITCRCSRAGFSRSAPSPISADTATKTGRFSVFAFRPEERALLAPSGDVIELTGAEYNLLAAFIERPNRILSPDTIAELTRKDDWDAFDRSIDTLVSRLRRKLAAYADASQLIQTVRGEGYVLATDVKWSGAAS